MTLPAPKLDDRSFEQLLSESVALLKTKCPEWSDLSVHDPGMMLLELFAHLTEVMLYRLNRVPERVYVELLRLIGVRLEPPRAARVTLTFSRERGAGVATPLAIPRFTRVTSARAAGGDGPLEFLTLDDVELAADADSIIVAALHATRHVEIVGTGTGMPAQTVRASRAPIVAATNSELDLKVGVEIDPAYVDERTELEEHAGKLFRVWREVEHFADLTGDEEVYTVDRSSGRITFAPAVQLSDEASDGLGHASTLAAVPPVRRQIALWYAVGGGARGNVLPGTLDTLATPLAGVKVRNAEPASGGRDAETVQNALVRGPTELYSLRRAVTARDYEALAGRSGAVCRARALTKAAHWRHAEAGTVDVVLVPALPASALNDGHRGLTRARLVSHHTEQAREDVARLLDARRPLGTQCQVSWAQYKPVSVRAKVVRRPGVDRSALKKRLLDRLHQRLSPLPSERYPEGWPFGQSLGTDTVYGILLSEPGVQMVDGVQLSLTEVPTAVAALASDPTQPSLWYAASEDALFRSLNDGDSWEAIARFAGEQAARVRPHPKRPGLLLVVTHVDQVWSSLWLSRDCGDSVVRLAKFEGIRDVTFSERDGDLCALVASVKGLYRLTIPAAGAEPPTAQQIIVDAKKKDLGFEAVVAISTPSGGSYVAAAARERAGTYISLEGGTELTFRPFLQGKEVDVLAAQLLGARTFLWAATSSTGKDPGEGCFRLELVGTWPAVAQSFEPFGRGWSGETVYDLAFAGSKVYAASHSAGVPWLDAALDNAAWNNPTDLDNGLPQRAADEPYLPIVALASDGKLLFAGSEKGIVRSRDGRQFERVARQVVGDGSKIALPETWLFCSEEHQLEVVDGDATRRA